VRATINVLAQADENHKPTLISNASGLDKNRIARLTYGNDMSLKNLAFRAQLTQM